MLKIRLPKFLRLLKKIIIILRDGFISFTTGNNHHPNSTYYKISSGSIGKFKVVGEGYRATTNDKSRIFYAKSRR